MNNKIENKNHKQTIDSIISKTCIRLELPGIFYVTAWQHYIEANNSYKNLRGKIDLHLKKLSDSLEFFRKYSKKKRITEKDKIVYADQECMMLQSIRRIELFYEPVVSHSATAQILLVSCAEAFINEIAEITLRGERQFKEFDKLSVVGKWLFLPQVIRLKRKFTLDQGPLQGFAKLVSQRNKLIHYKTRAYTPKNFEIPTFINDMGLIPIETRKGIIAVKELIQKFSLSWTGSYGPDWLNPENEGFRRPCFYCHTREAPMVLVDESIDNLNK